VRPVPLLGARAARRLWGADLGLAVEDAAARLPPTPAHGVLRALEAAVAVERLRAVGARAFAHAVLDTDVDPEAPEALAAARALGGQVAALGARVGRVLGGGEVDLALDDAEDGAPADVEKLLRAIVLYRRVFGAEANAPARPDDAKALRRTLGSSEVFEDALVEEARDRVVDLLTGEQ
jgi:hypothetical protein